MAAKEGYSEFEQQLQQEEQAEREKENAEDDLPNARVRRDSDGTVYEWDAAKNAWFPKIDDDFIARYQMSYGTDVATEGDGQCEQGEVAGGQFWGNPPADVNSPEYRDWYNYYYGNYHYGQTDEGDNGGMTADGSTANNGSGTQSSTAEKTDATADKTQKRKAADPTWFEITEEKNTNVYVSGLPPDITEEEYSEMMSKVGLVAYDPITRKPKLKLYKDETGNYKGDGRCCYIKAESVGLAMQIIDGSELRGSRITVEHAKFELKGQFDPAKKRRKLTAKEKKKFKEKQEKLFDWRPEKPVEGRPRHDRVVVIKNVFNVDEFEKDPALINEIRNDLREECGKYGEVRKVMVYDRHPDGVVTVTFKDAEHADACIIAVRGRWFGGRRLMASAWDGKTRYLVEETEEQMEARLNKWHSFLEEDAARKQRDAEAASSTDAAADGTVPVGAVTYDTQQTDTQSNAITGPETDTACGDRAVVAADTESISMVTNKDMAVSLRNDAVTNNVTVDDVAVTPSDGHDV